MKVVFYTNEYPPYTYGGAGVAVEYLTRELAKLMEVEVRCFGDQRVKRPRLSVAGYQPWAELARGAHKGFDKALEALSVNLQFCKNNTADIVHCHTWYTNLGGFFAKILHNIPFVMTTHSLEPLRPWKREQLGRAYDLSSWIEENAARSADAVIAVSQGMKDDILSCYDIPASKIHVIHNGIDLAEYRQSGSVKALRRWGVDPNKPYILFVGRITRQKGIIHLVNAIAHLDPEAQVVLCAGAPDTKEIAAEMEARVAKIQRTRKNVIWIRKMLPKNEIIELYSHAAVFCCPSIYEPFGIINVEAMACGTPVVASAVGGIKEVVVPERTGLLVPFAARRDGSYEPRNPEKFSRDLARALNRVLRQPSLRSRFSSLGRRRAETHFSWAGVAKKTQALYRSLI
ncbi:MAG: glycosyl transferase family 1 [Elusimicrobia bacterium GWC2_51_8]|nr:MAG: glycosyl transferase family 1 [Elusimicrobia bacterium GWA2_51_34]OGR60807.1 MAG: glycosyl transferase family 1 [Elusimicrobia bacterium GWC2_51_8]OGR85818.1 MAG: glycosyl transferase family 1 [Elusimicrobia bacterium GWF2_52_66]HCE98264.1 glycogen synthase [Elusimicrobiota bacterium]